MANEIDPFFQFVNFPADGSLGMGFSDTSPFNESSLFTNLVTNGAFVNGQPVIGLNLDQSSPELVIAGTDPKFSNALTFVNQSTPVSIIRGSHSLRLTRTRYRVSGSSRSTVSQSAEMAFLLPLNKELSTRPATISLQTQ